MEAKSRSTLQEQIAAGSVKLGLNVSTATVGNLVEVDRYQARAKTCGRSKTLETIDILSAVQTYTQISTLLEKIRVYLAAASTTSPSFKTLPQVNNPSPPQLPQKLCRIISRVLLSLRRCVPRTGPASYWDSAAPDEPLPGPCFRRWRNEVTPTTNVECFGARQCGASW